MESSQAQLQEIKGYLGPTKYKTLKSLTKQFASGEITPIYYVDACGDLFSERYADDDFWNFLPVLLDSCPGNPQNVIKAKEYMAKLYAGVRFQEHENCSTKLAAASSWGGQKVAAAGRTAGMGYRDVQGTATSFMAKELKQSKEKQRQQQERQQQTNGKKARKKKLNDELRALAFGGN